MYWSSIKMKGTTFTLTMYGLVLCFVTLVANDVSCVSCLDPTVMVSMLSRNMEHTLPYFLSLFEKLDYPKDRMSLWIKTDHNVDKTVDILTRWVGKWKRNYNSIKLLTSPKTEGQNHDDEEGHNHKSSLRLRHLASLKEQSLKAAKNMRTDYVWFLDMDVFLLNNQTLRHMITENLPIIAAMINSHTLFSNFRTGMQTDDHDLQGKDYKHVLKRKKKGVFKVFMVHSSFLVDLNDKDSFNLTYIRDNVKGYDLPEDYNIVFAISAKNAGIPTYIMNTEAVYGMMLSPLDEQSTVDVAIEQCVGIRLKAMAMGRPIQVSPLLEKFITIPKPDKMGFDEVFVINLERRADRKEYMQTAMEMMGIDAKFTVAVDGSQLNESSLESLGISMMPGYLDIYENRRMNYGEIGCFLSHYNIWKEMVDRNIETAVVFEDDINFEGFFRTAIAYLQLELQELKLHWNLIYLGRKILMKDPVNYVRNSKLLVQVTYSHWTLAYILNLQGAKKLLKAKPLQNLVPIDEFLPIIYNKHPKQQWMDYYPERDLVAFSVKPLLAYPLKSKEDDGIPSDTEESQKVPGYNMRDEQEREDSREHRTDLKEPLQNKNEL